MFDATLRCSLAKAQSKLTNVHRAIFCSLDRAFGTALCTNQYFLKSVKLILAEFPLKFSFNDASKGTA